MDIFTPEKRSEIMSLIRRKDTSPELLVRKLVWRLGYRYRIDYPKLPGRPDIAIPREKKAIFVHGCFWHRHSKCKIARIPISRQEYWGPKLQRNVDRDSQNVKAIRKCGWRVLVVWECEIRNGKALQKIERFLNLVVTTKPT